MTSTTTTLVVSSVAAVVIVVVIVGLLVNYLRSYTESHIRTLQVLNYRIRQLSERYFDITPDAGETGAKGTNGVNGVIGDPGVLTLTGSAPLTVASETVTVTSADGFTTATFQFERQGPTVSMQLVSSTTTALSAGAIFPAGTIPAGMEPILDHAESAVMSFTQLDDIIYGIVGLTTDGQIAFTPNSGNFRHLLPSSWQWVVS